MGNKQIQAYSVKSLKQASTSNNESYEPSVEGLSKIESLVKATASTAVPTARIRVNNFSMDADDSTLQSAKPSTYRSMITPLTQFQKNLLREAWQRISKKGTSSIGSQIVRRMFLADPGLKRVFHHVTVIEGVFSFGLAPNQASQHHSEMFTDILSEAIENIDDLSILIPKLNEYGARHAPYRTYGFKAEFWDVFGEAMITSAREWEGWCKHRETLRGWTILVSFLVDRMRQGYEQAVKRPTLVHQYSMKQQNARAGSIDHSSAVQTEPEEEKPTTTPEVSIEDVLEDSPPPPPPMVQPSKRSLPARPMHKRMSSVRRESRFETDKRLFDMQKLTISRDQKLKQQRSNCFDDQNNDTYNENDDDLGGSSARLYSNSRHMHSDSDLHSHSDSQGDELDHRQ